MKVYSEQVSKTKELIEGLRNNIDLVKHKGIDDALITCLEDENKVIATYNPRLTS